MSTKENKEAEKILTSVAEVVNSLDIDPSYVNYVLFRFTGSMLLEELGLARFDQLVLEVLDSLEPKDDECRCGACGKIVHEDDCHYRPFEKDMRKKAENCQVVAICKSCSGRMAYHKISRVEDYIEKARLNKGE